jgi:large repetitive protein
VNVSGQQARVDVRLTRGARIAGQVVTDSGLPVDGATVRLLPTGGAMGLPPLPPMIAGGSEVRSDSGGSFVIEGVAAGRHRIVATKIGLVQATEEVDVSGSAASVRLVMAGGGTVVGTVRGLSQGEIGSVRVFISGGSGSGTNGIVDPSGNFRIDAVPAGRASVQARLIGLGNDKSTRPASIDVVAGSETRVDLEFGAAGLATVRGRVIRAGQPVSDASVRFLPRERTITTSASGTTGSDGSYEMTGLEDGEYNVYVRGTGTLAYDTTYRVNGSGRFDVNIRGGEIAGRVIDGSSGDPIGGASLRIRRNDEAGMRMIGPMPLSDINGNFTIDSLAEGPYTVGAEKEGYGAVAEVVDVADGATRSVELRLMPTAGVTVRPFDARMGRPIDVEIEAVDMQGRRVYEGIARPDGNGLARLPLANGSYRVFVGSTGYASRTVQINAPASNVPLPLTRGGSVVIESSASERLVGRLVDSVGQPYRTNRYSGGELTIMPGRTTLQAVAGGSYTLQVFDRGALRKSIPVNVREEQTVYVSAD